MTRLLALAIGLSATCAIWHVQATSPRQLADTAEHALGWVCRMTYNDDGSPRHAQVWLTEALSRDTVKGCKDPAATKGKRYQRPVVAIFLRMLGLPRLRTTPVELRP